MEKHKNKLLIGLGVVVVLLIGIMVGNSGDNSNSSSNGGSSSGSGGSSQVEPPAPDPQVSDDALYIGAVRSYGNSYIDAAEDYQLIEIAHNVCSVLDEGYTFEEIAAYLVAGSSNDDPEFFEMEGLLIGSAVSVYCPEYTSIMP